MEKLTDALRSIGELLLNLLGMRPIGIAAGIIHEEAGRKEDEHKTGIPERTVGQVLDYFAIGAALAKFLPAATTFLDQLTGDRSLVRNPLLRALLNVGDKLSGLMSQLIGLAAFLIDRVAPQIVPLVEQGIMFGRLIDAVMDMVSYLLEDLSTRLTAAFALVGEVWAAINNGFIGFISDTIKEISFVLKYLVDSLSEIVKIATDNLTSELGARFKWASARVQSNPVVQTLAMLGNTLSAAGKSLEQIWDVYSAQPSGRFSRAAKAVAKAGWDGVVGAYHAYRYFNPSTSPPAPTWPGGPDTNALKDWLGRPKNDLADLGELEELRLRQRHGIDPLTPSWRALGLPDPITLEGALQDRVGLDPLLYNLDETMGFLSKRADGMGNPAAALKKARSQELEFRDYFTTVLGRLLPAEARVQMKSLVHVFDQIDQNIYGVPSHHKDKDFPVLKLKDNGQLYPRVGRILFKVPPGTDPAAVRAFADKLVERLGKQKYAAPGGP
jgi:hypothetical protein